KLRVLARLGIAFLASLPALALLAAKIRRLWRRHVPTVEQHDAFSLAARATPPGPTLRWLPAPLPGRPPGHSPSIPRRESDWGTGGIPPLFVVMCALMGRGCQRGRAGPAVKVIPTYFGRSHPEQVVVAYRWQEALKAFADDLELDIVNDR